MDGKNAYHITIQWCLVLSQLLLNSVYIRAEQVTSSLFPKFWCFLMLAAVIYWKSRHSIDNLFLLMFLWMCIEPLALGRT